MQRVALRIVGVSTLVMVLLAIFPVVVLAAAPFMPCCFNPHTGLDNNMMCCIVQGIAMQITCCGRFF